MYSWEISSLEAQKSKLGEKIKMNNENTLFYIGYYTALIIIISDYFLVVH